jgi:hypothetical protein
MLYKVLRPSSNDNQPLLIEYINICDSRTENAQFLYRALINNKIVPDNWFDYKELIFSPGISYDWVIRQRVPRRDILYVYPVDQNKIAKRIKLKSAKRDIYFDAPRVDWGELRFQPLNLPGAANIELQQQIAAEAAPPLNIEADVANGPAIAAANVALNDEQFLNDALIRLQEYGQRLR